MRDVYLDDVIVTNRSTILQVTGSGKTLAFAVPMVEMLIITPPKTKWDVGASFGNRSRIDYKLRISGAIVLSPTRELAQQTWEVLRGLVDGTNLSLLLLTAASTPTDDIHRYTDSGCNVIVATPGALLCWIGICSGTNRASGRHVLARDGADDRRACVGDAW